MSLFDACINGKEDEAAQAVDKMTKAAKPAAIWAILMHAAAWHEQCDFDTPHSTILAYSIHRMIENLGPNPNILPEEYDRQTIKLPDEVRTQLQHALIERLARNLAAIDHWTKDRGVRYNAETTLDSPDNAMYRYSQTVRERSQSGALSAALGLAKRETPIRLIRMTASLAAEDPDRLGHAFIMPVSLVTELPGNEFTFPHQGLLWHLAEYLVRKVPAKRPDGFVVDDKMNKWATPTSLTKHSELFQNAVIGYGILGHNGIFAQRIADAANRGLIHDKTVIWLLKRLKENIGTKLLKAEQLDVKKLVRKKQGTDWENKPSHIDLPHSEQVREWVTRVLADYWAPMMDWKSSTFEDLIPGLKKKDWPLVRAAQYIMSALNGHPRASHVIIYTHAVWSLTDHDLVPNDIAALQTHRMLRQYLMGR